MGDVNQFTFIRKRSGQFAGPFLEVGSKDYGTTQDLRSLFSSGDVYVGVDMEDGPSVDLVLNLTEDFDRIDAALGNKRFGTIFCLSVLEHCDEPFIMAQNLTRLLKPGGRICISAPFAWRIHGYPNDFWRFTPEGIKKLFPKIAFDMEEALAATSRPKEFHKLHDDLGKICFSFSKQRKSGHIIRGISATMLRILSHAGLLSWLAGYRHVFAPTNILMIGTVENS